MAVAIASTDQLSSDITTGVSTFSVTRAAGEGLIIGFAWQVEWEAQPSISSVVWDSTGDNQLFTLVDNVQFHNSDRRIAVYYLANPASAKSGNIKVNWSKSCASSGVGAYVRHITGHDTSSPLRGSLKTSGSLGTGSPISNTITSSSTDLVIDFMAAREGYLGYISPQSGQGSAYEQNFYGSNQSISTSTKAGASTVTTGYDSIGPKSFGAALIQLSIKEAAGGGSVATTISATLGNVVGSVASKVSPKTAISATLANVSGSVASVVYGTATTTITATLGNVLGSVANTGNTSMGTFTSEVLKDYAGNVLVSVSLNYVRFYNDTTGALVLNKTGVSANASGIVTFSDAALVAGTTYRVDWETSAGSRRMPRKAAA